MDGVEVSLTPTEYRILACLARHTGRVLTHEQILQAVWGPEYQGESHYLWVHMTHLRQKIEPDSKQPRYLLTERGVGYRLAKVPERGSANEGV
jgi:two-component system KDP operon response regulator KdpE